MEQRVQTYQRGMDVSPLLKWFFQSVFRLS